ncbi:MAG TPA: hypothetical protein EYN06_01070 [Myxococcales bacterium]|nr:hypothetical protein [Myxococcales bacterium]HIN85041.1 hypothetical protein [Myxococcales bacterium]
MLCRLAVSLVLVIGLTGLVVGCGGDSGGSAGTICGPGTHNENGVCVVDSDDGSTGTGTQTGSCDGIIEGDYKIENQDDIDALAGYCEITGNLFIVGQSTLTSCFLPALTVVGGELGMLNPALTSFSLPALTSVGGLHIVSTSLPSFSLPALTSVDSKLWVDNNYALTSFELPALTSIGDSLKFSVNSALASFSFPELTTVGDYLQIDGNTKLISFALPVLTSVGGDLSASKNTTLAQCLVDALVKQIEAGEGIGGDIWFAGDRHRSFRGSTNNTDCTCSEGGGVLEATCD